MKRVGSSCKRLLSEVWGTFLLKQFALANNSSHKLPSVCRYDSEYDNYRGGITSDCESEMNGEEGEKGEGQADNIRQISQNITNKFGNHRY